MTRLSTPSPNNPHAQRRSTLALNKAVQALQGTVFGGVLYTAEWTEVKDTTGELVRLCSAYPIVASDMLLVVGPQACQGLNYLEIREALDLIKLEKCNQGEVNQLLNIDANVISAEEWKYLASIDQSLATTATVSFANVTLTGTLGCSAYNTGLRIGSMATNAIGFMGAPPIPQRSISDVVISSYDDLTNVALDLLRLQLIVELKEIEDDLTEMMLKLAELQDWLRAIGLVW